MIKQFLFPSKLTENSTSIGLLIIRIAFGGMLLINHGSMKMMNFESFAPQFTGGSLGLSMAIFAEVFCSAGIIVGLLHRLALIPLIITMCVAFFGAHNADFTNTGGGEMALLYLAVFLCLFIAGAGKYSIDRLIANKLTK